MKIQGLGLTLLGSDHNRVVPFIIGFGESTHELTCEHNYDMVPLKEKEKVN
jgi:hypothetical protein